MARRLRPRRRAYEDRAPACTLLVFIDATSRLMQMRLVASESTFAYLEALEGYLREHGRPVAFHLDKHSIFRVAKADAASGHGLTQFGRALAEFDVVILCANSSQARGRVERANRTLQDRLVKEMRIEGIGSMEAANAVLPGFMARHSLRLAKAPARPDDPHRPLADRSDRLRDVLCWRDQRYVGRQLSFSDERKRIMLEASKVTCGLVGQYVDTFAFPDGRLEVRWKGYSLPYRAFDPDQQHVTHAAISEDKRLGAVLEAIKEMQEASAPKVKTVGKSRTASRSAG